MATAAEMREDDQIVARQPLTATVILTVIDRLFEPGDEYVPDGTVEIDVTCDPNADIWDMKVFAMSVGAEAACWLSHTPKRRYRLYYPAKASVPTVDQDGPR